MVNFLKVYQYLSVPGCRSRTSTWFGCRFIHATMSSSSGPGPLGTAFRQELLLFFCLSLLSSCCHSVLLLADHQQTIRFYKLQFSHSPFAVKNGGYIFWDYVSHAGASIPPYTWMPLPLYWGVYIWDYVSHAGAAIPPCTWMPLPLCWVFSLSNFFSLENFTSSFWVESF